MTTIVSPTETSQPRATIAVSTLNLIKTYHRPSARWTASA